MAAPGKVNAVAGCCSPGILAALSYHPVFLPGSRSLDPSTSHVVGASGGALVV